MIVKGLIFLLSRLVSIALFLTTLYSLLGINSKRSGFKMIIEDESFSASRYETLLESSDFPKTSERIQRENANPGTDEWWRPFLPGGPLSSTDKNHVKGREHNKKIDVQSTRLEGFTTKFSVGTGEAVEFKIDYVLPSGEVANNKDSIRLRIYRLGYYQGKGARLIGDISLDIKNNKDTTWQKHQRHMYTEDMNKEHLHIQPECAYAEDTHTVHCSNWRTNGRWEVSPTAVSGVYIGIPYRAPFESSTCYI